jgi:hypothetical protein
VNDKKKFVRLNISFVSGIAKANSAAAGASIALS